MSATIKPAAVSFPLTSLRPLYSSNRGRKLVVEVDIKSMKRVNEPGTIDEMVAEAKIFQHSPKIGLDRGLIRDYYGAI